MCRNEAHLTLQSAAGRGKTYSNSDRIAPVFYLYVLRRELSRGLHVGSPACHGWPNSTADVEEPSCTSFIRRGDA